MNILREQIMQHPDGREIALYEWEDLSWTIKLPDGRQVHYNPTTSEATEFPPNSFKCHTVAFTPGTTIMDVLVKYLKVD